jgi:DnaJ family protein C protein 7
MTLPFELNESADGFSLEIALERESMNTLDLKCSANSIRIDIGDKTMLQVPLPKEIATDQVNAKYNKKKSQLVITLPFANKADAPMEDANTGGADKKAKTVHTPEPKPAATPPAEPTPTPEPAVEKTWEEHKAEGNKFYSGKEYRKAIECYTRAIGASPSPAAALYGNRSAAHLMILQFSECVRDCKKAIEVDANYLKGYGRCAKAYASMGSVASAEEWYALAKEKDAANGATYNQELQAVTMCKRRMERCEGKLAEGQHATALSLADGCLEAFPDAVGYHVLRVRCLLGMKKHDEAFSRMTSLLRADSTQPVLLFWRGNVLYHMGDFAQAVVHFQQAIRGDPDNKEYVKQIKMAKQIVALKGSAERKVASGQPEEAVKEFSSCLEVDPANTTLRCQLLLGRAEAHSKNKSHQMSINDCGAALRLDSSCVAALVRRAASYQAMGEIPQLEQACQDLEMAVRMTDGDREMQGKLRQAKGMLKNAKRKDLYKILGVSRDADETGMKKAYRKSALKWHPDRHSCKTEEEKATAEAMFKDVNEAFGILSDPEKRKMYDEGGDIDEIEQGRGGGGGGAGAAHMQQCQQQ